MAALQKLASIFNTHTYEACGVNTSVQQTLSTSTTPAAIHKTPRTHGRKFIPLTSEGGQIEATEGGRENETTTLLP